MRSENYTNVVLSVISPENDKFTEQSINGGSRCATAVRPVEGISLPDCSQEYSELLPLNSPWRPSRNQDCSVGTDRLTVVLMAGLPGAGKTTLAYTLQRELGWKVIDKDSYKEGHLRKGLDDYSAGWNAYEDSFEEMRVIIVEQQASMILDCATLDPFVVNRTMEIMRDVPNAQLKVILCIVDRDLRIQRLNDRSYHRSSTVDPRTDVPDLYYFGHLPANIRVLSTARPLEECLAEAREYVLK